MSLPSPQGDVSDPQVPVLGEIEAHLARLREAGELDDVGEGVMRRHFQARADQLRTDLGALLPEYQRRLEAHGSESALQWLSEAAEALGRRDREETHRVLGTVIAPRKRHQCASSSHVCDGDNRYPVAMPLRPLRSAALALVLLLTQGCMPQEVRHAATVAPPVVRLPVTPVIAGPDLAARLASLARIADPKVIRLALEARQCAASHGDAPMAQRLAVIDYSRPSTEQRLWVFDLAQERLLYSEVVAHGRNTGDNVARQFSNVEGSLQSSIGLFRTAETYEGENGYSLRMDGLEPGVNDLARQRAIVMHGAWYVDPLKALSQGRLGRSLGCPALRPQVARKVIDALKQGQMLFAYYPDERWLTGSRYLGCRQDERVARGGGSLHAAAH